MNKKPGGRRALRVLLLTLIVLISCFAWVIRSTYTAPAVGVEETLDRVYMFAVNGQIAQARVLDEDAQIVGEACSVPMVPLETDTLEVPESGKIPRARLSCKGSIERFHADYPRSNVSTQQLLERITTPQKPAGGPPVPAPPVVVDKQTGKAIAKLLITFVFPLALLANLFGIIFMSKSGDNSLAGIAGFGRISRKRARKRRAGTGVTFADVAGAEEAVAELREVTDYLTDPKQFEAYGAAAPKGVLMFGPPGCGKTLLARAAAGESGVPFFSISGAEFVESLVGVGAARVRDLFRQVRDVAPAIVFIDEIDAVGRRRAGEGNSGGEREQTVNQLLVEMDGFDVSSGIVLMAATNRPDILDPALLRPGRFDRHVTLQPPDVHGREAILRLHAKDKPIAAGVDFAALAQRTPGFTGADLANVINEGALLAVREGKKGEIGAAQLSEAVLRVLHGPQRRGRLMRPEERHRLAVHEAGHAVVAAAFGHGEEVHRVSIVARGKSLGTTAMAGEDERVLLTAPEMHARLAMAVAGVVAETVFLGDSSTTAADDIERATTLAREMVGLYGMSPGLGRIRLLSTDNGYLGGDGGVMAAVSGATMGEFDHEVRLLIVSAERAASAALVANRASLERVVEALEREETLEASTLETLLVNVVAPDAETLPANGSAPLDKVRAKAEKTARATSAPRRRL